MFGNTEKIAAAVARGLQLEGVETALCEARSAPDTLSDDHDLVVVGGPTHAFSMSRARTRADAARQGAGTDHTVTGIREWLEAVRFASLRLPLVAAFDTRVTKVRWIPEAAGPAATRLARRRGLEPVMKPVGFLVEDLRGPLVPHELDRATAWGRRLGVTISDRADVGTAPAGHH
jgi:hypothetical protein